jgi:hypothetical protein
MIRQRSDTLLGTAPPAVLRRSVSFDPSKPPLPFEPAKPTIVRQAYPSLSGPVQFKQGFPSPRQTRQACPSPLVIRKKNRLSTASAYYSARSRPSTAGTTFSAAIECSSSPRKEGGRDKPLPPAPGDDSQDDSGVFLGDVSSAPFI